MSYQQTEGKGSNVYLVVQRPRGRYISVGIIGPRGGQGDVAHIKLNEFLRVLINTVGPLALVEAMAIHKKKATGGS